MATLFLTDQDEVGVYAGPLFEEPGEDGIDVRCNYFVEVIAPCGKTFRLKHGYRWRQDAEKKVTVVKGRGVLNLDHWVVIERMSLEAKFDLYAQGEAEVRLGLRAEGDEYHGIPY